MGQQRTQPGGRVDKETYERFREFVRQKHGAVRGNLGTELTKAMEDRMDITQENSQLTRIENDLATIKAQVAEPESDGGATVQTSSEQQSARPPESGKPAPNSTREKKVQWLIGELFTAHNHSYDSGELAKKTIRKVVNKEYAFSDDVTDDYVSNILSKLSAKPHPDHGQTYLWGHALQEARDELRDRAESEAEDTL